MKIIVAGCASGKITRAQNPINFLGAVDQKRQVAYAMRDTIFLVKLYLPVVICTAAFDSSGTA